MVGFYGGAEMLSICINKPYFLVLVACLHVCGSKHESFFTFFCGNRYKIVYMGEKNVCVMHIIGKI